MLKTYKKLCEKICELTSKSVPEMMIIEILLNDILIFEKDKSQNAYHLYLFCVSAMRTNNPQAVYILYSYLQSYIRLFEFLKIGDWSEL